jgi:hypothetical protein
VRLTKNIEKRVVSHPNADLREACEPGTAG